MRPLEIPRVVARSGVRVAWRKGVEKRRDAIGDGLVGVCVVLLCWMLSKLIKRCKLTWSFEVRGLMRGEVIGWPL